MRRPEQTIQRAIWQHVELRLHPDAWICHIPNGGARSAVEAAIMKGLGVQRGAPDLIAVRGGQTYALELKAMGGRLSASQRACHEKLRQAGAIVGVAVGLDQAIEWLEAHGLLRGVRQ